MSKNNINPKDKGNITCLRGQGKAYEFAQEMIKKARQKVQDNNENKMNAVWLETSGCFGEVISLLNAEDPNMVYFLQDLVNMNFFGSISGAEGEKAYEKILETINSDKDYILFVSGAIPIKANGLYTVLATYKGVPITAMDIVKRASVKAKHIIAVGTCATYGGPTAASPNVSDAFDVSTFLKRKDVINISGCPAHPAWTLGTVAYLINYGSIDLDKEGRPVAFYGETIHSRCPRRRFFDNQIFAEKLGDPECMFKLGCRGPITRVYCPVSRWNNTDNWPIGDNTPCIGCAGNGFPDSMEPFTTYFK